MIGIDFKGQIAIVTGGSGGIGKGIVRRYAEAGAKVYIADLFQDKMDAVKKELSAEGLDVDAVKMDVTDKDEVTRVIDSIAKKEGRIDFLCNAAGIIINHHYSESEHEEMVRSLDVNVIGMNSCCLAVLPYMLKAGYGRIVNIGSASTRMGSATTPYYATSKFAVMGLTQSIALDVAAQGITCNGICPGLVMTDMFEPLFGAPARAAGKDIDEEKKRIEQILPTKRYQTPEEMGDAAVFLSSPMANSITGQMLNVCGGFRLN